MIETKNSFDKWRAQCARHLSNEFSASMIQTQKLQRLQVLKPSENWLPFSCQSTDPVWDFKAETKASGSLQSAICNLHRECDFCRQHASESCAIWNLKFALVTSEFSSVGAPQSAICNLLSAHLQTAGPQSAICNLTRDLHSERRSGNLHSAFWVGFWVDLMIAMMTLGVYFDGFMLRSHSRQQGCPPPPSPLHSAFCILHSASTWPTQVVRANKTFLLPLSFCNL